MNTADTENLLEITAARPNPETLVLPENHDSVTGTILVNVGDVRYAVQYTIAPDTRGNLSGYSMTLRSDDRTAVTWTDEKPTPQNGLFFSRALAAEAEAMFKPTIIMPPIPEDK
jgi:hypothetical protein